MRYHVSGCITDTIAYLCEYMVVKQLSKAVALMGDIAQAQSVGCTEQTAESLIASGKRKIQAAIG